MPGFLDIDGVSKSFGGLKALDGCSFSVAPNRATCLVGPNGAGKTTLFDVITGLLRPTSGQVVFEGQPITRLDRREIVKRGIARTFQNLRIFDELTVVDNVIVCLADETGNNPATAILRPYFSNAVVRRKTEQAMDLLKIVGLDHKAGDLASQISFGQQKLLCVARVLATDSELLLLDEPTSGLSAKALDTMVEMIDRLRSLGKTLLVVEHNTQIVRRISDDVVFMHQGRVLACGDPDTVLADRKLIEIYFGGALGETAA
ncbi:ABC transporter ATP-binding protein [Microbaculum marinum]|uniref:ABC transporter ATP-binding protein n=1 Tax=Microbaculum marinum TaxID=1764581 RepID=A0AAW9RL29_9HYPH